MAIKGEEYHMIEVESYLPESTSGLHGKVHIRPVAGQDGFPQDLRVECSKDLSKNYPVGSKFRIKAKLTDLLGGGKYVYSSYQWTYTIISEGNGPIIKD